MALDEPSFLKILKFKEKLEESDLGQALTPSKMIFKILRSS
jgi:hypothetical protein